MNAMPHRSALGLLLLASVAALLSLLTTVARAQETTERLIMKDGTYQSVEKYEMQGDRVHYLSAERYEWEDIPASLIDWDATKKYNEKLSSGKMRPPTLSRRLRKRKRAKRKRRILPKIAPGVESAGQRWSVSLR